MKYPPSPNSRHNPKTNHGGEVFAIVNAMKATGNRPGIVAQWKRSIEGWAMIAVGPEVEAVRAWLPLWQVRSFYTAAELAPLFPVIAVALGFAKRPGEQKSPVRLASELKFAGLPFFEQNGETYFIVEQCHRIEEFRNAQHG